jgi:hypothetical protein
MCINTQVGNNLVIDYVKNKSLKRGSHGWFLDEPSFLHHFVTIHIFFQSFFKFDGKNLHHIRFQCHVRTSRASLEHR